MCLVCTEARSRLMSAVLGVGLFVAAGTAPVQQPEKGKPAETPPLTVEQHLRSQEGERLWFEANKLRNLNQVDEAINTMEKALTIFREVYGNEHLSVANGLFWLSEVHRERENFVAARKSAKDCLAIRRKLYGEMHWWVTDARLNLEYIEYLSTLGVDQRRRLAAAERSMLQVPTLFSEGRHREGLKFAQQALEVRKELLGQAHQQYAFALYWVGMYHLKEGEYALAEPLLRQNYRVQYRVLGPDHPTTDQSLKSLEELADKSQDADDLATAQKVRQELVAIQSKRLGEGHWQVASARLALDYVERLTRLNREQRQRLTEADQLMHKADALEQQGRYREALQPAQQARELFRQELGERHKYYGNILGRMALQYVRMGEFAPAETLCRQALEISREVLSETHPDYANSLNNLAVVYFNMGDYGRAEPLLRQGVAIKKQAMGEAHPEHGAALNNLAELYRVMGKYAEAAPTLRQAVEIRREMYPRRLHRDYAESLNNLALLYQDMGDFAQAEPLFLEARAVLKAWGEKHPDYASCLNNLARLYRDMGKYDQAVPLFRQAADTLKQALGKTHFWYAATLTNLASVYASLEDYDRVEHLCREAQDVFKKGVGDRHAYYATTLSTLAGVYLSRGDYNRAEPLYQEAHDVVQKALGETHPAYMAALLNLALLYQAKGDDAKAEPLLRKSLELARRLLDLSAASQSERQQLAMTRQHRLLLDAYLGLATRAKVSPEAAYRHVLGWKGAVFARQRQVRLARGHPELAADFVQLQIVTSRLATLALAAPDPKKPNAEHEGVRKNQLEELTKQKENLEASLARRGVPFAKQAELRSLTPGGLQVLLPRDTALVDFLGYWHASPPPAGRTGWKREQRLVAFIVRPDRPLVQVDLGEAEIVRKTVQRWRMVWVSPRTVRARLDPGPQLRQRLWQPLEEHLKGVKTVLVSPDSPLAQLPLAALPGKEPNTYLLEELAVAVVPVPQLLPELLARPEGAGPTRKRKPSLLLVGDVDYGAPAGLMPTEASSRSAPQSREAEPLFAFQPLPGTRTEVKALKTLFTNRYPDAQVQVLRGGEATEAALRQQAPKHSWLHLATHGFFAPRELRSALEQVPTRNPFKEANPEFYALAGNLLLDQQGVSGFHPGLLSGLALAGANGRPEPGQDDGILTALEVAELDLEAVELAVLSACETGLGEEAGGEGVLGLQRAFQVSGARTAVASLWQVADEATRLLIERMYTNLWTKKMSKLDAMREAQLWMLREGRMHPSVQRGLKRLDEEEEPKEAGRLPPYYWAGFVLSGDWR